MTDETVTIWFVFVFLMSYFQFFGSVPIRWSEQPGNGGKARLGSKAEMPPESSSWNIHAYWRCLHSEILMLYLCTQVGIPPVKDSWLELIELKHGKWCTAFSVYDTVSIAHVLTDTDLYILLHT